MQAPDWSTSTSVSFSFSGNVALFAAFWSMEFPDAIAKCLTVSSISPNLPEATRAMVLKILGPEIHPTIKDGTGEILEINICYMHREEEEEETRKLVTKKF